MKLKHFKIFFSLALAIILTLGLSVSGQSLLAVWTAPSATPPDGNMNAPFNTGTGEQLINGSLKVSNINNSVNGLLVENGKVGIGTVSPYSKLQVNPLTNVEGLRIISSNYSPLVIRNTADTADLFRVKEDGNVGIGTANPLGKISLTNNNVSTVGLYFRSDDGTLSNTNYSSGRIMSGWETNETAYAQGFIKFDNVTAADIYSTTMTLKGGNVGIGTVAPTAKLEINQPALGGTNLVLTTGAGNTNALTPLRIKSVNNNSYYETVFETPSALRISSTMPGATNQFRLLPSSGNIYFQNTNSAGTTYFTGLNGVNTARVIFLSTNTSFSGNTGIGTATILPLYKLDVIEATPANVVATLRRGIQGADANMVTTFGKPYLRVGGAEYKVNSVQSIGFGYSQGATYTQPAEIGFITTNTAGQTLGDMVFALRNATTNTAPVEVMRITAAGNVGIGTIAPKSKLQVVGLPEYANNDAALAAGLTIGAFYRTGDLLKVVH